MRTFKHYVKAVIVAAALYTQGCTECALECDDNVIVDVTEANGDIASDFVVTATVQGVAIAVDCGGNHNRSVTGTVEGETIRVRCRDQGVFLIENVTDNAYVITVDIVSPNGSFSGALDTRSVETNDGNGVNCGECTYASPHLR
jgi:hypothetical protein